jgi:hypothetical protein
MKMRRYRVWLAAGFIAGALTALFYGCQGPSAEVALGEEAALAIGETVLVPGQDMEITFTAITADSRCARDVTCFWAGEVTAAIEVNRDGVTQSLELTQPGAGFPAMVDVAGYNFTFSVSPYPEIATEAIADENYRLHLTVTR